MPDKIKRKNRPGNLIYKEPHTITLLRRQVNVDLFGVELALNVLRVAVEDMLFMTKSDPAQWKGLSLRKTKDLENLFYLGKQSYLWIHEPRGRFEFWCWHLGFEPDYVRKLIKKELKHEKRKRRTENHADASG